MVIGHDLNVIRHLSNRIIVMYMGKICTNTPGKEMGEYVVSKTSLIS